MTVWDPALDEFTVVVSVPGTAGRVSVWPTPSVSRSRPIEIGREPRRVPDICPAMEAVASGNCAVEFTSPSGDAPVDGERVDVSVTSSLPEPVGVVIVAEIFAMCHPIARHHRIGEEERVSRIAGQSRRLPVVDAIAPVEEGHASVLASRAPGRKRRAERGRRYVAGVVTGRGAAVFRGARRHPRVR